MPEIKSISSNILKGRRRVYILVSLLMSLLVPVIVAWELRAPINTARGDFKYLYGSGKLVLSGEGSKLYEPGSLFGIANAHGPFEAILFLPIAAFPFRFAVWFWWTLNIVMVYASFYLLLPLVPKVRAQFAFALMSLGIFVPVLIVQVVGQDTLLTCLLFAICIRCIALERFWIAGSTLALATYKPNLALPFLGMLLMTSPGSMPLITGFVITCTLLLALSMAVLGVSTVLAYPQSILRFEGSNADSFVSDMPNVRGLLTWLFQNHLPRPALQVLVLAISIGIVVLSVWCARRSDAEANEQSKCLSLALLVIATLLVGYHDYAYDLALLLLPISLLWGWAQVPDRQTWPRRLLNYSAPILICSSLFIIFEPRVYTCIVVVFFVLICRELLSTRRGAIRLTRAT